MRRGGESDKLGNSYEALWTVHNLLDLLHGKASELQVEPLEDGEGVEFFKTYVSGSREYHSVKIQTTENVWNLRALTTPKAKSTTSKPKAARSKKPTDPKSGAPAGRTILGDLLDKLRKNTDAQARFVSETSANPLNLICKDAEMSADISAFRRRLSASGLSDFQKHIVPCCGGNEGEAFSLLKRLSVVNFTARDLADIIEREIALMLHRQDGEPFQPAAVRRLFAEIILSSLGTPLTREKVVERLEQDGFHENSWATSPTLKKIVDDRNRTYLQGVRGQLINNAIIKREEAKDAFRVIVTTNSRYGAFVGIAGLGKSCTAAELLDYLRDNGVPHFALRLDDAYTALTPRQLGKSLDLPMSPVDVLYGMAGGQCCVLLLDQLDALSIVSGRNASLWSLVDQLLGEVDRCPNMRVWLACRAFDLEHDPRLRELFKKAHRIDLRLLTIDEVKREVRRAGVDPEPLGARQVELLRTPMHLSLFLEGDPAGKPPFQSVQDLYESYWERKQDLVKVRLGRSPQWIAVIDRLCDALSDEQTLSVDVDVLDAEFREDARAMVSENVLGRDNHRYRFFHEQFFDYAFARRFVQRGRRLVDLLLKGGEQHLFRRAQVRQILSFLRWNDSARYLEELTAILYTPGVRSHIVRLVLDWLRALPNPMREELKILSLS